MSTRLLPPALALLLACGAAGCATAHAKAPAEVPALAMPAAPPRLMTSSDTEQAEPAGLIREPARTTIPDTARRPPAAARPEPGREEPPRMESPPPPPAAEQPKPAEEPKPSTTLQMPLSVSEIEAQRNIQTLLNRAQNDLKRVNVQALNADAKTQYDLVNGYVRQANDAVHQQNYTYAMKLAERAAVLAAQLAGR